MTSQRRTRIGMLVKNVFLIEDDQFFAKSFLRKLEPFKDKGIVLHHYENMQDALEDLVRLKPEVIFLDHHLSGMSGIDSIPIIKVRLPCCEIAIVSNQKDVSIMMQALETGAFNYFAKDSLVGKNSTSFIEELLDRKSKSEDFLTKTILVTSCWIIASN
ncbi:MAG: DNA-binding NtrC family response regulator [Crocinitomicaceae bacterium]|jgi:DNA-binding NtrC family response regulator